MSDNRGMFHETARKVFSRGVKPLALAALFAVFGASAGMAASSATLVAKAPDAEAMIAKANDAGSVRVIVKFASDAAPGETAASIAAAQNAVSAAQDAIIADHFGSATAPSSIGSTDRALRRMTISPMFAANVTAAELESLAADPRVVHIYVDGLNAPTLIQSLPIIGMPSAYSQGGTGLGQAVAVLDTGAQTDHEFLTSQIVLEHCFSTTVGGGSPSTTLCPGGADEAAGAGSSSANTGACWSGGVFNSGTNICQHGTHVAGIAAGYNSSYSGGAEPANGVAYLARLVTIQVFSRFANAGDCLPGTAPCVLSWDSDTVAALDWLYANARTPAGGVRLASVNMSLGGGSFASYCDGTDSRTGSINNLRAVGIGAAISSGNSSLTGAIGAPGCISNAVTVGASTKTDTLATYSNQSSLVDVLAPGGSSGGGVNDILSSIAGNTTQGYNYFAGTSMAAPHVAGAIAAIRSACSNIPYNSGGLDAIVNALKSTGTNIFGRGYTIPRINVASAIPTACAYNGGGGVVALDPLTLTGLGTLALIAIGWQFRRRRTA